MPDTWPAAHEGFLCGLVASGKHSFERTAELLNEEFGTSYTRNACIGKARRHTEENGNGKT